MSLTDEFGMAVIRGAIISVLVLATAPPARALLLSHKGKLRWLAWMLLLVPYLTPFLLVGYGYSSFSLSLVHYPLGNEALYLALLAMKLMPVAALVLYFFPSPTSQEALHCYKLLQTRRSRIRSFLSNTGFHIRANKKALTVAFSVVFLFALGEFEMASLLGINSWTVKLFDAQAGGLFLGESFRLAFLPMIVEGALLAVVLAILYRSRHLPAVPARVSVRPAARIAAWIYLCTAFAIMVVIPAILVLRGTLAGFTALTENFVLAKDIGASILFGLGAAAGAFLLSGWLSGRVASGVKHGRAFFWAFFFSAPGLFGALLLSLTMVFLFQRTPLNGLYDTPVPLLAALILLILPYAVLLMFLLHTLRPSMEIHLAELLGRSPAPSSRRRAYRLLWELKHRGRFWVAFLLFCWAYFDMTASSLLSPSDMTPVFVRLYNLMHYGRNAVLSASVCVAFLVPFVLLFLAMGLLYLWHSNIKWLRHLVSRVYSHG